MDEATRETADLVRSVREGKASFEELIRAYQEPLWRAAYRIMRNHHDAEDVVQEAFIKAYRHLDSYDPRQPFEPWIRRIAVNTALTHLRKKTRSEDAHETYARQKQAADTSPASTAPDGTLAARINDMACSLNPLHRTAFALHYMENLSVREISDAMGKKVSTVKSYLFRARTVLRKALAEKGVELS